MVDCGSARCAQDRRVFRKDLMSWSKKIPLLLGLEAVLEKIAGRRLSTLLLQPLNGRNTPEDWVANEKCSYCEDTPSLTGSTACDSPSDLDSRPPDCGKTPEIDTSDQEALMMVDTQIQPPFCSGNVGNDDKTEVCDTKEQDTSVACDLSATSNPHLDDSDSVPPSCPVKPKKSNGRRAYSEEELAAAISEIQNGKIGTRRASSLYGIPRSTLRNKIFKLESSQHETPPRVDESDDHLPGLPHNLDSLHYPDLSQYNPFMYISPYMFPTIFPYSLDYLKPPFIPAPLSDDINFGNLQTKAVKTEPVKIKMEPQEEKLDQIRKKHNIASLCKSHEKGDAVMIDPHLLQQPIAQQLKLSILPNLIRKLAQQRLELERSATDFKTSLDELMIARQLESDYSDTDSDKSVKMSSVIGRNYPSLPGAHPMLDSLIGHYYNGVESSTASAKNISLGDVVDKTIISEVKGHGTNKNPHLPSNLSVNDSGGKRRKSAFCVPDGSPNKKIKKEPIFSNDSPSENFSLPCDPVDGLLPLKKTRPKRGQYRKYNSQLLTEAVKSVQRGEMSVHRAGSYYGVPHSTLEYKVKERHLLRQKKVRDAQLLKESQEIGKSPESPPSSGESSTTNKTSPPPPTILPFPDWLKQSNSQPVFPTGASSLTTDMTMSTPASELLKKLQQKVKSNPPNSDGFFPSGVDLKAGTW